MKRGVKQRLKIISRASIGMLVAVLFVVSTMGVFAASPPNMITYQGRLLDSNSVPVTDASLSMIFELYDDPTAGSCVWSNSSATCATATGRTVTLTDGLFSENLGDTGASTPYAAIGDDIFADNAAIYLKVTVAGEALSPRKQLTSAPYALNSETLDGLNSSATGGTSAFVPVTDSSGNLTLTGDPTGTSVSTGVVYINPTTAAANETILGAAVNGTQALRVTGDGDLELTGSISISDNTESISLGEIIISNGYLLSSEGLSIDSEDPLYLNYINDEDIITGTGDFTANGNFYSKGDVTLGDASVDTIAFGGLINGVTPMSFSGGMLSTQKLSFVMPSLTTADRTVTFQDASGTVALTSDLTGSSITLDTAYDAGGSGAGRSITADSGAVAISATSLGGDDLFSSAHTASGALTANTTDQNVFTSTRTLTSADTIIDDYDVASIVRQAITNNAGADLTSNGSVLYLENDITATAGALADNAHVLEVVQDGDGLGNAINVTSGNVYVADSLDVDTHGAFGSSASVGNLDILTLSESISCTADCSSVDATLTNTTNGFTNDAISGNFTSTSAVASGAGGDLVGVKGSATTTGSVTYLGDIVGAVGTVSGSGTPTYTNAYGVNGQVVLNNVSNVTGTAAAFGASAVLTTNETITGNVNLFSGTFAPSNGTVTNVDGLSLILGGTGGTVTNPIGAYINLDPSSGTLLAPGGNAYGIDLDVSGNNTSGNDANVFGIDVSATTSTTGTPAAYGVRSTASGGTTNYSGYFYGSLFQVDANGTADINNAIATGAGDIYATGNIEADGNLRVDGGNFLMRNSSNLEVNLASSGSDTYSSVSIASSDGGGTGGDWQMYTLGGDTVMGGNGAASDFRWTLGGGYNDDSDVMRLTTAGELFLDTGVGVGAADLAEVYVVNDLSLTAGDLVSINSVNEINASQSSDGAELLGVVSTQPGLTLGNGEDDVISSNERAIALSGRVPVKVNIENGSIEAGDPITVSSVAGEGMKATGPGMILGFALESYVGGGEPIDVFVNLQWNPGGKITADGTAVGIESDLIINSLSDATASNTTVDSESLVLRGSAFDVVASDRDFSMSTVVTNATDYRLSIKNVSDTEVAYIDQDGAFSVAGDMIVGDHLYPSDRGVAQTNRYIFYDGSEGPGGDFMRTNASGWATGSYDFAEMFPSDEKLEPGDVVVFASKKESVKKSTGAGSGTIAGVVSTRPGFLAGENKKGNYPIALAGRVPTKVSNENGAIQIGDALTASSSSGVAMKATEPGMILGYAMEDSSSDNDSIIAFINATYWNGLDVAPNNTASGLGASLSSLDLSGDVYIGSNDILNVGSISGIGMRWEIAENGDFKTTGLIKTSIEAYNGEMEETYATTATDVYITIAGTAELQDGRAGVNLVKENPTFNAVVSNLVPLKVIVTPRQPISVYVDDVDSSSFDILQINGSSNNVEVDWYVIGIRKGFEPEEYLELVVPEIPDPEAEIIETTPPPPEDEDDEEEVEDVESVDDLVENVEDVETEEEVEVVEETIVEEEEFEEELYAEETEVVTETEPEEELGTEEEEDVVEELETETPVEEEIQEPIIEETEPVLEEEQVESPVAEAMGERPASDVSPSPELEQIPDESSNVEAGTAPEGSTE